MRQDSIFFDGSLADNLSMYRSVSDEKLMDGLRRLGLDHLAKPEVLHAPLGQYSGGEARRLMVLRALLRGSEIIILDEPLANLDPESIRLLEEVLAKEEDRFHCHHTSADKHTDTARVALTAVMAMDQR